jgi:hypothetical protein
MYAITARKRKRNLGRAADHVGDKVAVAGRVEQRDPSVGRFKLGLRHVHGDATRALLLRLVEHPCKLERGLANLLRLGLVPDRALYQLTVMAPTDAQKKVQTCASAGYRHCR